MNQLIKLKLQLFLVILQLIFYFVSNVLLFNILISQLCLVMQRMEGIIMETGQIKITNGK